MPDPASQAIAKIDRAGPTARPDLAPPDWDGIEKMLDELPPGIPILPPEDATNFSKYRHPPPMMPAPQAWKICTDAMEKYDSDLCKAYREEIDTLLVFAGLFSAVVTGFTVESYQWLQDDPSDTTNALLAQIARSLEPNGTAAVPPSSSGMGRSVSARINAYWFISLALSLSAALVAILGKQWIREFERRASDRTPKELIGVRQLKFEGLEYWKVGDIISALPMLLQLSLALFALGIIDLLWHLHAAVAVTVCIPTAAAVLFYLATTILPVLQYSRRKKDSSAPRQCAYKSPQSLAAIHMYQIAARAARSLIPHLPYRFRKARKTYLLRMAGRTINTYFWDASFWNSRWTKTWNHWDTGFYLTDRYFTQPRVGGSPFRGLYWLSRNVDDRAVQEAFWNCLWDEAHSPDTHPADEYFSRYADRDTRLRQGIMHDQWIDRVCTHEFMSEFFIQCLPSLDVASASYMFWELRDELSEDRELVRSLVKAVLSYGRQHMNEDIDGLIASTSSIVARCPDYATQSALQWVLVLLTANWLRSPAFAPHSVPTWRLTSITTNAFEMLSHSPEHFIQHPHRLRHLPHILALAELVKTLHEYFHGSTPWPVLMPDDLWRYGRAECKPMVMEVFRISVRGVDYDSLAGPSERATGRGDSIARQGPPPPDAMLPEWTAAAETARSTDTAGPISRRSDDDGTVSASHLPSPGVSKRCGDARDSPPHTEFEASVHVARVRTPETVVVRAARDGHGTRTSGIRESAGAAVREPLDADTGAGHGEVPALGDQDAACDAGIRSAGECADAQAFDRTHRTPAQPDVAILADGPSLRRPGPQPRSVARLAEAPGREDASGGDSGRQVDTDGREQLDAARGVRAAMGSTIIRLDHDQSTRHSSAICDETHDAVAFSERETAAAAGEEHRDSLLAAADRGGSLAGFAPRVHAGLPELSLPGEVREAPRASETDDLRPPNVPCTDQTGARSASTHAVGRPETHDDPTAGQRAGEAEETAGRTISGHAPEARTSGVEPSSLAHPDLSAFAVPVSSHDDDHLELGVEEMRGPAQDIGSGRVIPGV